jgi:hypothetical protein
LLHQLKIPKLIELSYYAPPNGEANYASSLIQSGNQNINFIQIGHFALDDNLSTNF